MKRKKKGVGSIVMSSNGAASILAAAIAGGVGGYIHKFGSYSPIVPTYAGAGANILLGIAGVEMLPENIKPAGYGLIAVGTSQLLQNFGIGGAEIINGADESKMLADYNRAKIVNGTRKIVNGSIINGFLTDNAVHSDSHFMQ